ncbi:pentapeptide repeat-containing protein [Actinoplanes couchii]|uniref:pentapeptide repeat-containing protein n=1 Tax=Actinoplanes couchii TaxID=403638 RepID=UPI0035B522D5
MGQLGPADRGPHRRHQEVQETRLTKAFPNPVALPAAGFCHPPPTSRPRFASPAPGKATGFPTPGGRPDAPPLVPAAPPPAVLRRAVLRRAVLRRAVLRRAVLRRAVLRRAVLRRAVLRRAPLRRAAVRPGTRRRAAYRAGASSLPPRPPPPAVRLGT